MKNKVFQIPEFREYYLSEFELYDGECFITFNIVGIDEYRNEITVAVTNRGGIGHQTFDFKADDNGLYFEYGLYCEKNRLDDFEQIKESAYCSLLLSQNVPIQTVSKYMGHSDSTVTLEVYSTLSRTLRKKQCLPLITLQNKLKLKLVLNWY